MLLGREAVYDGVRYLRPEQFGRVVQPAGHHDGGDLLRFRGDPAGATWATCWLRGSGLRSVLTVDRPRDAAQARRMIGARQAVDPVRLAETALAGAGAPG